MSSEAGERRTKGSALHGTRRRIPVAAHVGDRHKYAARVHRAAREAGQDLRREEYLKSVFDWATDERLLWTAFEDLQRFGGPAPGIDGMTYDDIPTVFVPSFARGLRDTLRTGRFTASDLRSVMIPKLSGNGLRELLLAIIDDRVIGKAIHMAISPFLDAGFDERSFGFRPGRDRLHALAHALAVAQREERWHWAVLDIKDAFPSVSRKRLEQILRMKLPNGQLCFVINQLSNSGRPKGIPQGQPLCPLLLNVHLDHTLDKPWRRLHPDTPLIRVADDLLILGQDEQEAAAAIKSLKRLVSSAGMQLKGDVAHADKDLKNGEVAHWLGLRVRHDTEKAIVTLGESCWRKLQDRLENAPSSANEPRQGKVPRFRPVLSCKTACGESRTDAGEPRRNRPHTGVGSTRRSMPTDARFGQVQWDQTTNALPPSGGLRCAQSVSQTSNHASAPARAAQ